MENYIAIPNLPMGKVSLAIVDGRIGPNMEEKLSNLGMKLIKTELLTDTYAAVSGHPDIMLHHVGGNRIIVAPNISNRIVYELQDNGFEIILGEKPVGAKYPDNVGYNAARVDRLLICNVAHTDQSILEMAQREQLEIVNIRQGYAKCSICIINKNAIVTSDVGIKKVIDNLSGTVECCLIEPGHIELAGMNHGFIGGASGLITESNIAFYGNIYKHPDFKKINEIVKKYGKKTLNLCENTIMDFGTLIPLKEYSIMTK